MALSQCSALIGDVPRQRARSGLGPLGRKRLQGGTEAATSRDTLPHAATQSAAHMASFTKSTDH